jgi:hypothetical protein
MMSYPENIRNRGNVTAGAHHQHGLIIIIRLGQVLFKALKLGCSTPMAAHTFEPTLLYHHNVLSGWV